MRSGRRVGVVAGHARLDLADALGEPLGLVALGVGGRRVGKRASDGVGIEAEGVHALMIPSERDAEAPLRAIRTGDGDDENLTGIGCFG